MGSAVQINDPISTLGLKAPLMVEIGTNMKNALDLLQGKEQNCILIVENDDENSSNTIKAEVF